MKSYKIVPSKGLLYWSFIFFFFGALFKLIVFVSDDYAIAEADEALILSIFSLVLSVIRGEIREKDIED